MEQKLAHKLPQMSQQMNFACHKKKIYEKIVCIDAKSIVVLHDKIVFNFATTLKWVLISFVY